MYMKQHEELYSSDGVFGAVGYGSPAVSKGLKAATYLIQFGDFEKKKILCVGSGNGFEAVKFIQHGCDVTILDMYKPDVEILKGKQVKGYAQDLPFEDKEFDLYFCCEMMEHVEKEHTIPILKEAKRVSDNVFFTIAEKPDPPYNTHINLEKFTYWHSLFEDLGFEILNAQHCPRLPLLVSKSKVLLSAWKNGILIYAKC